MTTMAPRRMTLEEFLRLRERKPALEFIDGEVSQKVAAKARHGALQLEGAMLISAFARPNRLARAFPETRATFSGRSYVPDVVVYRWDRIPTTADGEVADDVMLPPDIAIEVISPGRTVSKLSERCRWFVAYGVAVALLVVPRRRTVYRFHAREGERALTGVERIDLDEVLPGLELTPTALFAALRMD
jgi:Uma2 family endonuclease